MPRNLACRANAAIAMVRRDDRFLFVTEAIRRPASRASKADSRRIPRRFQKWRKQVRMLSCVSGNVLPEPHVSAGRSGISIPPCTEFPSVTPETGIVTCMAACIAGPRTP